MPATLIILLVAACAASHSTTHKGPKADPQPGARGGPAPSRPAGLPQALVTAESENRLLVTDLRSGRIVRLVPLPPDPEDLATNGRIVIVVSSRAGTVTALDRATLRPTGTFGGFDEPHIATISPDGRHAYVTDDRQGTLTAIRLSDMKITTRVAVGAAAHHLTFSPDQRRLWIALGESASQIEILDTSDPDHPHLIGHFSPGFPVHDLSFSPSGRQIWITSATGHDVTVFDPRTRRLLFRVPAGSPPQHLAFDGADAYITSGYGATIEKVVAAKGRVLRRANAPYGSFELSAADGYVATASLLRGTLAIYSTNLVLLHVVKLAPATREVAISRP